MVGGEGGARSRLGRRLVYGGRLGQHPSTGKENQMKVAMMMPSLGRPKRWSEVEQSRTRRRCSPLPALANLSPQPIPNFHFVLHRAVNLAILRPLRVSPGRRLHSSGPVRSHSAALVSPVPGNDAQLRANQTRYPQSKHHQVYMGPPAKRRIPLAPKYSQLKLRRHAIPYAEQNTKVTNEHTCTCNLSSTSRLSLCTRAIPCRTLPGSVQ